MCHCCPPSPGCNCAGLVLGITLPLALGFSLFLGLIFLLSCGCSLSCSGSASPELGWRQQEGLGGDRGQEAGELEAVGCGRVCVSLCVLTGTGSWAMGCWSRSCSRGWWRRWAGCPCRRWRRAGGTQPASAVRGWAGHGEWRCWWQPVALRGPGLGNMGDWCPWSTQCCQRVGLRAKLCLMRFFPHITEAGDLYVWGWNESGQLALPSKALAEERAQAGHTGSGECCWPG